VSVNTGISGGTGQVFTLAEGNVFTIGVLVTLGKTEIDDEDVILVLVISSDQKVIRLDITMDDSLLMDLLNSLNLFKSFMINVIPFG
jgi:hypothetical protein